MGKNTLKKHINFGFPKYGIYNNGKKYLYVWLNWWFFSEIKKLMHIVKECSMCQRKDIVHIQIYPNAVTTL